jgi:hypothetical protein
MAGVLLRLSCQGLSLSREPGIIDFLKTLQGTTDELRKAQGGEPTVPLLALVTTHCGDGLAQSGSKISIVCS